MPIPSTGTRDRPSWLARVQAQYRTLEKLLRSHNGGDEKELRSSDAAVRAMPRYYYDASLLFRRMILLKIDRCELAREEPLLLRELQGFCTLCASKAQCVRDLERECESGEPQEWQEYCPNSARLDALHVLQNCPRATVNDTTVSSAR